MSKVAWIGLGVMGYPMAGHLKTRGHHDVVVFNRTSAKAEAWVAEFGGKLAPTPAAAAQDADFIFTCVGNDNDLRAVTLGPDGAFSTLKPGALAIDNTPRRRWRSPASFTPPPRTRALASSMPRCQADSRARRTARSRSWSAGIKRISPKPSR
jgi:hypothetical protein